jgi:hypothetical protein
MTDEQHDFGRWSNRRLTQVAGIILVVVAVVTTDAYSLMAGIVVLSLALVFLGGSFFIERDFSPITTPEPMAEQPRGERE